MRQTIAALVAVVLVVGTIAVAPAVGAVVSGPDAQASAQEQSGNQTDANATIAPGERLSGVVNVQEAEIEGEIESRSFGLAVARAANDNARAALIAAEVNETGQELSELEERRDALREARQNGSISQGQFAARMAELAARGQNVERMASQSANASQGVPADLLEANGVNATAIQTLQSQANNLTGQEIAEIARNIAGNSEQRQERGSERGDDGRQRGDDARSGNQTTQQPADTPEQGDTTDTSEQGDTNSTSAEDDSTTMTPQQDGDSGGNSGSGAGGSSGSSGSGAGER